LATHQNLKIQRLVQCINFQGITVASSISLEKNIPNTKNLKDKVANIQ
jgi:hypothetical protein